MVPNDVVRRQGESFTKEVSKDNIYIPSYYDKFWIDNNLHSIFNYDEINKYDTIEGKVTIIINQRSKFK